MKALYRQLIEVKVTHDYYDSGYCNDFLFVPTAACNKFLKRNGLYFKQTPFGFKLIYKPEVDDDNKPIKPFSPFIPIDSDLVLDFKMVLKNKLFGNFTNLPPLSLSGDRDILFFDNDQVNSNGSLNSEVIKLRPEVFERSFKSLSNGLVEMEIDNSSGIIVNKGILASSSQNKDSFTNQITYIFQNSFDVSKLETDVYTLKVQAENINEKFYPSKSLIKDNIFGIVRIIGDSNNSFDFDKGKTYNIAFSRKTIQWKYYIVCKNSYSKLKISENSATPQIFFEEVSPAPSDSIKLFKSVTNAKVDQTLPLTETPKKGIQLLNDTTVLVENLPNPSINDTSGEKYIYV